MWGAAEAAASIPETKPHLIKSFEKLIEKVYKNDNMNIRRMTEVKEL
jgi:hypothetical protein